MGIRNLRAICPACGGKIHTQPKGLGKVTWANSGPMVETGGECQHCGVALSGKVGVDKKAILAEDAEKSWWDRNTQTGPGDEIPAIEKGGLAWQEEIARQMDAARKGGASRGEVKEMVKAMKAARKEVKAQQKESTT
jgi:hypothetical protein